jgi:small redox-active disulfide protein 2
MSLFRKKNEAIEKPACVCNGDVPTYETESSCCCGVSNPQTEKCCGGGNTVKSIKVLGAGCKSCHEQFEYAKKAVEELGLSVEVEYITDMEKVMAYGVMSMPAIVVNEKVVSMGKVLKSAEVIKLLGKLGY